MLCVRLACVALPLTFVRAGGRLHKRRPVLACTLQAASVLLCAEFFCTLHWSVLVCLRWWKRKAMVAEPCCLGLKREGSVACVRTGCSC